MKVRIGTRRSPLARVQTELIRRALERAHSGLRCEIVAIETTGDQVRDRPLRDLGGKGLFVKELDEALLGGAIDCAVHSLKDVPSELVSGVVLAAVPERAAVSDLWISRDARSLDEATEATSIGTTSLRRAGQARARNPKVAIGMLRGNVETRLKRVRQGDFHATLLAAAGVARLDVSLDGLFVTELDPWSFVPAPGQGALGVTARADDDSTTALLGEIDDARAATESVAERTIARRLGGSCDLPLGALARVDGSLVRVVAVVVAADGRRVLRREREGQDACALGEAIADDLVRDGAHELLAARSAEP